MAKEKPFICTFYQLAYALRSLHLYLKPEMDRLHDVWKMGAPSPQSRILNPKIYDPRIPQYGNYEARIVFPTALSNWIKETGAHQGIEMSLKDARKLVKAIQRGLAGRI